MHAFYNETFILFEPHPLVNIGLQALVDPNNKKISHLSRLKDIVSSLNDNEQQTVIMELYHHTEEIYQVVRFVLTFGTLWPKASLVVFTDIINPDILSLLATQKHLSLVAKRDSVNYLLAAISAAHPTASYRSPAMRQLLLQELRPLSGCEWRILGLMVAGANAQHAAQVIGRSYKTVCTHKLNIMRKLGLNQVGFMQLLLAFRTRYWDETAIWGIHPAPPH
ncbi:LuxR C-terminal-related transcriptional regulator [Serratia fonticola]|uniref:LuxR C-terminal-related transcriptional regulator n=1 Tax=Serratia fonticola TaxID=47917 RepID=UPI001FD7C8FC|nr:LuxR C-terminal-related transcriptional regulator [Serratia fonticola]